MINSTILAEAKRLKKKADAAYLVFKKRPTADNAASWTSASRAFNEFCVQVISDLITEDSTDKTADILARPDDYKTCKKCNSELLYLTSTLDNNYIASSDFLEDFPGWCYPCLLEHCANTECSSCTVAADPSNCSFLEIKNMAK